MMSKNFEKFSGKRTRVAIVVDRSSSMGSIRSAAFDSINEQLMAIKANADKTGFTEVTYIQFDNEVETVFKNVNATVLQEISQDQYVPRGTTAIFDAVGTAIDVLRSGFQETPNTAYLVVLISDGQENSSKNFTREKISSLTKELVDSGKWTFSYMLSNITFEQMQDFSRTMNTPSANIMTFTSSDAGLREGSVRNFSAYNSFALSRDAGELSVDDYFTVKPTP